MMCIINKDNNYEEQLLSISNNEASKFELLSITVDWALQRIERITYELLSQLEVRKDIYVIKIEKSFTCDTELIVMFEYKRNSNILTLLSVRSR